MGEKVIAFDIGESQLKLVWYSKKTRKKAVCAALPENLVANGEIVSMDAMADFIKETAKKNGIPRGDAAVVLPASRVFTRSVEVPKMTETQLDYNLPYEFKDYLGQEKSEYYFDYAVEGLAKDEAGNVKEMKLFAATALKKTIEDYRDMFRRAGYSLKVALPEEIVYRDLIKACKNPQSDTCFVDIGYRAIRMYFFKGEVFSSRRSIDIGIRELVESLSESRGITMQMAYEHMRSNYDDALIDPVSQEIYHSMAIEILKAVNFYNYNNRAQKLNRIYLCGGGADLTPIRDAIAELTDMELLSVGNILSKDLAGEEAWLYARAIGCAMEAQTPKKISLKAAAYPTKQTINLAKKESHKQSLMTLSIGIAAIAVLAFCVTKFAVIDQFARQNEAAKAYGEVHSQYTEMEDKLSDYSQVEQEYHTYSKNWMTDGETGVSIDRMDVLDLIEKKMMTCGTVDSVNIEENTVIVNMSGMNLKQISSMFTDIQKQDIVESAKLTLAQTAKSSDETLEFSVTITLTHTEEEEEES